MLKKDLYIYLIERKINKYIRNDISLPKIIIKLVLFQINWAGMFFWDIIKKTLVKLKYSPNRQPTLCIKLDGAIGDMLVASVFIKELSKHIPEFVIDLFSEKSTECLQAIFPEHSYFNKCYGGVDFNSVKDRYDIGIIFRRLPYFDHFYLKKKIQGTKSANFLIKMHKKYANFKKNFGKFFYYGASNDSIIELYSAVKKYNRISQLDIANHLKITKNTPLYLDLTEKECEFIDKYKLYDKNFITITRSVDTNYEVKNNTKVWPTLYYEKLIKLLKKYFPNIDIIQLGPKKSQVINGIDLSLIGKTTLNDVKAILKFSILHIDNECGMVHIRHFLNRRSAVIFGPTPLKIYGYPENINITANNCEWCEWIYDRWQNTCILNNEGIPPCLKAITPEKVFSRIYNEIQKQTSFSLINKKRKLNLVKLSNRSELAEVLHSGKSVLFGKEFFYYVNKIYDGNFTIYDRDFGSLKALMRDNSFLEYGSAENISKPDMSIDNVVLFVEPNRFAKLEICRILKSSGKCYIYLNKPIL